MHYLFALSWILPASFFGSLFGFLCVTIAFIFAFLRVCLLRVLDKESEMKKHDQPTRRATVFTCEIYVSNYMLANAGSVVS